MLLTIIAGTNRPNNIREMISNLNNTAENPEQIEIIFAVDTGDEKSISVIKELQQSSKVKIKYLEDVRSRGYFSANQHYNKCLHISDPTSYFFSNLSDKVRFETKGWDTILSRYIKHFDDDVFRVRISVYKNVRYNFDLRLALCKPDNFAFHTRKFIELCGGWGDLWGPDSWAQGVVFFCELFGLYDRDLADSQIELEKYEYTASNNVDRNSFIRSGMINWSFDFLSTSNVALFNFYRIALKMKIYTEFYEDLKNRSLSFAYSDESVRVLDANNNILREEKYFRNPSNALAVEMISAFGMESSLERRHKKLNKVNNPFRILLIKASIFLTKFKIMITLFLKFCKISLVFSHLCKYKKTAGDVVIVSKSDQFIIEQNAEIEKHISDRYHQIQLKASKKF